MSRPVFQLQLVRRLVSLVGWTAIDQALFALSNLVITLAVARGGGTDALGSFSIAFAAYLVVLGCSRSLVSEPLLATPRREGDRAVEAATITLTSLFALAGAFVVGLLALLLGRVELLVVAVAFPVVLVHDLLRYHAFRRGMPAVAALLDGGWLLGAVIAWPVVTSSASPSVAVLCWAGGAVVGIGAGYRALRPRFSNVSSAILWWRREAGGLARPLLLDSIIVAISAQAVVFVVASMAGDSELGTLRAGQIYFGPMMVAFAALGVLIVPHLAQRPHLTTTRIAIWLSVAMAAVAGVASIAILAAEPILRVVLYAGTIDIPQALLIPLACQAVLAAASGGFALMSKVRHRGGDIARSRLTSTAIGLVLLVAATAAFGVQGAAWALVVQMLFYTIELGVRVMRTGPSLSSSGPVTTADAHV